MSSWTTKSVITLFRYPTRPDIFQESSDSESGRFILLPQAILDNETIRKLWCYRQQRAKSSCSKDADCLNDKQKTQNLEVIKNIDNAITLSNQLHKSILETEIECLIGGAKCEEFPTKNFYLYLSKDYKLCANEHKHVLCKPCFENLTTPTTFNDTFQGDYRSRFNVNQCIWCFNTSGAYQFISDGKFN